MNIDISFRMKLRWLLTTMHTADFWQDVLQKTALIEQVETSHPMRIGHDFNQLIPDPFLAHSFDLLRILDDRLPGSRFDLKLESSREADRAQQTQMIFTKSFVRISDRSDQMVFEIGFTANKIDYLIR